MSKRKSNKSIADVDVPDLKEAVIECVRFIVCREGSKIPIKRAEVVKHLETTCSTPSNLVNKVVLEANNTLKRVYGYKLIQIEKKSDPKYIIVLDEDCESLDSSTLDQDQRRLLISALLHIFMSGGPVKEDDMWMFLSEAGVLDENDYAGRKIMTKTFTRQMYLTYTKVGDGDMARTVFDWGQRATEELPKMYLLKKMAEAFEKSPDHWCEQYKAATEETGSNT
ncbi:non-structural maintenance of chromosomes element 3 homolog [Manduca sexta]|uniref:MAGE domain-containing protein n=1 Tax=Manduca sexta TaxID=7130 RepID=A0A921YYI8_MANSE|nr:non-structural maintenance of chromosomes element 3 homolog [Manduca sexta]KAG6447480.1 hypothetical protein O3G_MSEX004990 [Manduca sexta]